MVVAAVGHAILLGSGLELFAHGERAAVEAPTDRQGKRILERHGRTSRIRDRPREQPAPAIARQRLALISD